MLWICIGLILLAGVVFSLKNPSGGKIFFVVFAFTILFLYAALRNPEFSGDLAGYVKNFDDYAKFTFEQMLVLYKGDLKDPTYHLLGWLFSRVLPYSQAWIAFLAAVYLSVVATVVYTESEHPCISCTIFLSLGFFAFSLTGMRQTLAMAITMLAFYAVKNRKPVKFVLIVLLASLFHSSAIIFLVVYPLARRKLGLLHLIIAAGMFALFFFGESIVREWIALAFEDTALGGYSERETTLTMSGFIIQAVMLAFALFYYRKIIDKNPNAIILFNLAFIGLMFQLFSSMIAEAFRVSMYFSVFNILLVPLGIEAEENYRIKTLEFVAIPIVFIVYIFMKGLPAYQFFWM